MNTEGFPIQSSIKQQRNTKEGYAGGQ